MLYKMCIVCGYRHMYLDKGINISYSWNEIWDERFEFMFQVDGLWCISGDVLEQFLDLRSHW